jgi:hypothetical protein
MLQAALVAKRRVLGSAHPDTLATAKSLECVRSAMHAKQPTKRGGQVAARKARVSAAPLSPTALVEAEARAAKAAAELLAMLELEEAGSAAASSSAKRKAKAKANGKATRSGGSGTKDA